MDPLLSSSDDEAPDEIGVSSTKQEKMAQLKTMQIANRERKETEKERRRQRHAMFHQQKEKKLQELSKRVLPADVLEGIPAKSSKMTQNLKEKQESDKTTDASGKGDKRTSKDSQTSDNEDEGFDEKSPDFIPLGSSNLAVVTEDQASKFRLKSAQSAMDFKQNHFYGQKQIPRETTQQRRARVAKKRAMHQR